MSEFLSHGQSPLQESPGTSASESPRAADDSVPDPGDDADAGPAELPQDALLESHVQQHATWLLQQLTPFCGRHIAKVGMLPITLGSRLYPCYTVI